MTNHIAFYQSCSAVWRKGLLALCLALCVLGLGLSATAKDPTYIYFNPTNSVATDPSCINSVGMIAGWYYVADGTYHAFVRDPRGKITVIDPPGAVVAAAYGMNELGEITGDYWTCDQYGNCVAHGFLRAPDGKTTSFDAPGAVYTFGVSVNLEGVVAGYYFDANGVEHGFLRTPNNKFTLTDPPGATEAVDLALNLLTASTGAYVDTSGVEHSFLRSPFGKFTTFDPPDAAGSGAWSINLLGVIAGEYFDANVVQHGYVRAPDGTIKEFSAPDANTVPGQGTFLNVYEGSMNLAASIVGGYIDVNGLAHSFVRAPDGTITEFDPPPNGGTGVVQSLAGAINLAGAIVGGWSNDTNGSGYLRLP